MRKIILLLLITFLVLNPLRTYGETNTNEEIDLSTSPGKVLFDLSNIKPGDSVSRNLIIKNNGNQDFNYLASSKFLSGSEIFYDKLDLTIKDKNEVIYIGKLFEFNKLSPRLLKSKENDSLLFYIKVPMELGNEFQGLSTDFQIKLYVEGTLGGTIPVDGPKLPETGTNMFNILVAGVVFVLTGSTLQFFLKRRKIEKES
ncbi:LPXTG cell wall anchor domain-containing protein [Neobacillus drentensis]|uniref:LPXTG cell wall anchor domain-containing protein n=1 Tax=Neobacillus drentensis TaxID=220684 RepID=UPI0008248B0E|nr:LPXTG cell wall anchor domain-containing protein [Neobacillus drentensis]